MIALRMRANGHSPDAVPAAIGDCAPSIRTGTEKRRNRPAYAERTMNYAFGYAGDRDLQRNARYLKLWQEIEGTGDDNVIILITGASHIGKTLLAQKILENYKYPYLSLDLLKMGLIRSKNTNLSPENDDELTDYLWPIVREVIKTAIENKQNLVVEGCYIPHNWNEDFSEEYKKEIKYYCIIMSREYIKNHFSDIKQYANIIEQRMDDSSCTMPSVIEDNARYLENCKKYGNKYILIDSYYQINIDLQSRS